MIRKIIDFILNLLIVLVGILLIAGLFYIRLIPRQARNLWENMSQYQVAITVFAIIVTLISIYMQLKSMQIIVRESKGIFLYIGNKVKAVVSLMKFCLRQVYYVFVIILDYIGHYILGIWMPHFYLFRPVIRSFNKYKYYQYYFWGLLVIRILPIVIYISVFGYDVFYCHNLKLSFKFIPILLIPLLEKVFVFILHDYYELHGDIQEFMQRTNFREKNAIYYQGHYYSYSRHYNVNSKKFKSLADYFINYFLLLRELSFTLEEHTLKNDHIYIKSLYLLLTVIRLIILFYILVYGLT